MNPQPDNTRARRKAPRPVPCGCDPAALPHRFDRFTYCPAHHVLFGLDRRSTPARWLPMSFEVPSNGTHCQLQLANGRLMVAHRVVFNCVHGESWASRGLVLMHRDRDPLNNRLENLRLATPSESVGHAAGRSSRDLPRNVYASTGGGYLAQVQARGKVHSQWFKTIEQATHAAAEMRRRFFGVFALSGTPVAPA